MSPEFLLCAPRLWLGGGRWLAPGALHVREGRIAALGAPEAFPRGPGAPERVELVGCALLPGLVNAHAHLELTGLGGKTASGADFGRWIQSVVGQRAAMSSAALEAGALVGARLLLASGVTTVGDFDATGAAERALTDPAPRPPGDEPLPRVLLYREVLDARDPARTAGEIQRLGRPRPGSESLSRIDRDGLPALPPRRGVGSQGLGPVLSGLAPHGPHTVSPELLRAVAAESRREGLPLAIHWAETEEEVQWLERGGGLFDRLLGPSPRASGLELLQEAGLLGPALALVHGNLAREDERARVSRAGAVLVHCPGTHAFFGRAPFPIEAWRSVGVTVALGTDSLASNVALDLRRELGQLRSAHPDFPAQEVLEAATVGGARALGLQGRVGVLATGAQADLLAVEAPEQDPLQLLERLASGEFEPQSLWIGGRPVESLPARDSGV